MLDDFERDLMEMVTDMPVDYYIGGTKYQGAVNESNIANDGGHGGLIDDYELTIIGQKSAHRTTPAVGTTITFQSKEYKAVRIVETPGDRAEIRFECISADQ